MTETTDTKDEVRRQMRQKRHAIGQTERRAAGMAICKKVAGDPVYLLPRAWRTCIYLSTAHEIPTRYIARAVWESGHEVCVPAWSASLHAYRLYSLAPSAKLITGRHGIREPAVRIPVETWDVNAFILPGLAFDACGGRLGYGGGHYDALLNNAIRTVPKIAICYDWQVLDTPLPQEPHDIPMDWIVTDKRVINCAANRRA